MNPAIDFLPEGEFQSFKVSEFQKLQPLKNVESKANVETLKPAKR